MVLVIIGIVITFAVLSVGGTGLQQKADEEARRLAALMNIASEQAVLQSTEYGVLIQPEGFSFAILVDEDWHTVQDDDLLRQRTLPKDLYFELFIEDVSVVIDEEKGEEVKPQLLLFSSGEHTPFSLTILSADAEPLSHVVGEMFSPVRMEKLEQP